ncbi:MAG TPA: protein kinase [Gemmatimonadales bacterium]
MTQINDQLLAGLSDRYRVERELGAGGMATVYLARDLKHDREVALKVLRPELGAVLGPDRFLAEIKITARLDHPHILTLIDSGADVGLLYYVLPFARGESLRDLLNREKQLGVEQALAITRQIGGALDYAHRQGVVHRDIKPENILIQEGHAMLTDFGIALAVKEAGGSRLTETGLSLGTPQYMSPEQATGDRTLDARSDLYSLAAVLYEMLAGEPPLTGPTVQSVIAKLLTEQPIRIRTVRATVPEAVDAAVAKALAKVPADRFTSAGEFVRALEAASAPAATPAGPASSRLFRVGVGVGAVAVIGILGTMAATGRFAREDTSAALRERTQLTFSGAAFSPALSSDGKQLAFIVRDCDQHPCTWAVEVQDVGGTTTRRVLEGATATYGLEWSPDRRNLILSGTYDRRYGSFLVSALGGPPRYLTAGAATFFAGGDSLLLGPPGSDSVFTIRVAGIDGTVRDSIRLPGPGTSLAGMTAVPGTSRFVALIIQPPRGLWQVVERSGKVTDRLLNTCTCPGMASADAIWMTRAGPTAAEAVVRVALDPATGKLAAHQDTIYSGRFTGMSVTADGAQMAVDDGSYTFTVAALSVPDLLAGTLPQGEPLMQASTAVGAGVSPDGSRLLMRRVMPTAEGSSEPRYSVRPFDGGAESPLATTGRVTSVFWVDSVSVALGAYSPTGLHLEVRDVRTGVARNPLDLPDSTIRDAAPLPDGWVVIPKEGDRIVVMRQGQRREIPQPAWSQGMFGLEVSPDGSRLLFLGWGVATSDSLRVEVVPVDGGAAEPWVTTFAESGSAQWLADGSILFKVWPAVDAVELLQVRGPGQVERLGAVPHRVGGLSVSNDLRRAAIQWRDYRGDAWLYRVVNP